MAGTVTPDSRHATNYSIVAAQHWGLKIEIGTYTPSTGSTVYTSVGDSVTFHTGKTPEIVVFETAAAKTALTTRPLTYQWDGTNGTVRWLAVGIECTTTEDATAKTAKYCAISF